eukprot:TRINITY_DN92_c0_g1_i1.p1 TRINITY_DN92_c0_g1~~TRINITY_DN92_c0_g1_i1.p1  ORF type:complete len:454 (-),score=136.15 TRINITY_DN92_c0_g1_i1:155-1450(-)
MQTIFEEDGEEFFFMNQNNLGSSISDLFFSDNIMNSEELTGSPSDSQSPPSYMTIPTIQPNLVFKQENNSPIQGFEPENNKRKRTKAEKENKEKGKSVPKKIRKKHPEMQTSVTLSREKLLTTSTEDFNKWVDEMKSQRALTQEEVSDIRRQKRLIRNRESAQASRDRKKNEFILLEKQIKQLKEENQMAMKEITEMRYKINNLETENLYMKTTIQHNPVLNEIYTGIDNIPTKNHTTTSNSSYINSKTVKNAGVCLFLLIFSFGLFFNVQNTMNQTQPKVYNPKLIPSANLLPITGTSSSPNNLRTLGSNARRLLTHINNMDSFKPPQTLSVMQPVEQVSPVFVKSEPTITNETMIEQKKNEEISLQPNIHLYCMNAKEYLINPTKDANDLTISLNIPKHILSKNSPIHNHINSNDDIVEVLCKIVPHKI